MSHCDLVAPSCHIYMYLNTLKPHSSLAEAIWLIIRKLLSIINPPSESLKAISGNWSLAVLYVRTVADQDTPLQSKHAAFSGASC